MVATETRAITGVQTLPERRVVLHDVSWETYEQLLADQAGKRVPHLNYIEGALEIVSPTQEHEQANVVLAWIVEILAEEWSIDFSSVASMTFKRAALKRGFEADSSYYFQNEARVRHKKIDPDVDPPPDLVIEIDVTDDSMNKLPLYVAFRVPEVWRFVDGRVEIRIFRNGSYVNVGESLALPVLTSDDLTRLVAEAQTRTVLAWRRHVRDWARSRRRATGPASDPSL